MGVATGVIAAATSDEKGTTAAEDSIEESLFTNDSPRPITLGSLGKSMPASYKAWSSQEKEARASGEKFIVKSSISCAELLTVSPNADGGVGGNGTIASVCLKG